MATRSSKKNDNIELAKIEARVHIFAQTFNLAKLALTLYVTYKCVECVVEGLKSIVQANPDSISALAAVVQNFHLSGIVGSLVGVAGVSYGMLERRGKKRLLQKYDHQRRLTEQNDPYNASSGLTPSGDTPN